MPSFAAEYCEYFCGSGVITCRVLYRTEQLAFVQFRTVDWPGYKDFSNYARVALFPEHLRPTDPQSPGVRNFVQALHSEVAAQQQYVSNYRHRANGQCASDRAIHVSKPKQENGQGALAPKTCATVTQGNRVNPSPKPAKTPARGRKASASGAAVHSLKPAPASREAKIRSSENWGSRRWVRLLCDSRNFC
jgi:hypothetical protein